MKRIIAFIMTLVLCIGVFPSIKAEEVKADTQVLKNIAVDINGSENRGPLKSPVFTDWTINNVNADKSVSLEVDGITFTLSEATGKGIINGTQNRELYSETDAPLLTLDGATIQKIFSGGIIKLEIAGLSEGLHTITTWHSFYGASLKANDVSTMTMSINGEEVATGFAGGFKVKNDRDACILYNTFEVKEGETATVLISSDGNAFNKTPVLNAFEIDGVHPNKSVYGVYPENGDGHFDVEKGFSWTGAEGVVSHDVYLGTDYYTVANATNESSEFLGNVSESKYDTAELGLSHMETYYWRVDEVFEDGTVKGKVQEFQVAHLAFPTAEGYGRFAKGGRGGKVIEVTTLEDGYNVIENEDGTTTKTPIEGSLRYAIECETGPRIIVFKVGGVIELKSRLVIDADHGNVYVAGQTAPGDGITLVKYDLGGMGAEDVIIRNVRVRIGDASGDSLGGMGLGSCDHSIIDHCSISWSIDEGFSSRSAKNITFQNNIIAEALNNSVKWAGSDTGKVEDRVEGETERHSFAASISGDIGSFHHNLLIHCTGRNWSLAGAISTDNKTYGGYLDISNNVVYNYRNRTTDGGVRRLNFVNNYYKMGPESRDMDIVSIDGDQLGTGDMQMMYVSGNMLVRMDETPILKATDDAWAMGYAKTGGWGSEEACRSDEPFYENYITLESAEDAFDTVIEKAGAVIPQRDYLDARYVDEAKNGTYTYKGSKDSYLGIIDSQEDVGGYPNETNFKGKEAPVDTDHDGMPDEWEILHGLDPENYADNCVITLSAEGYTNIEMYLNELMGDSLVWINEDQKPTATATPEPTETETAEVPTDTPEPSYLPGDVDMNEKVDAADALLVLKKAAKLEELDDNQILAGDVVKDDTIDAKDALQILKYAARIIDSF